MAQYMKRWESPRREGRNDKGRGGSARQRQRQKQLKRLAQTLKQASAQTEQPQKRQKRRPDRQHNQKREESLALFPLLIYGRPMIGWRSMTGCYPKSCQML